MTMFLPWAGVKKDVGAWNIGMLGGYTKERDYAIQTRNQSSSRALCVSRLGSKFATGRQELNISHHDIVVKGSPQYEFGRILTGSPVFSADHTK